MRIVIDARPFIKPLVGIGNVLLCFLKSLQKHKDLEIYLLLPCSINKNISFKAEKNVHIIICPLFGYKIIPRFIWFFIQVPLMLKKIKPDLFYSPIPNIPFFVSKKIKKLITIHDVVNLEYKQTMTWSNRLLNWFIFKYAIKNADFLWANSNYTKTKINQYFPKRKSQNIFVGCSVDREVYHSIQISKEEKESIKLKYNLTADKFILFVGSLEPRKNLTYLLSLMPELSKHNIQLLVVGGKGWKNTNIKRIIDSSESIKKSTVFAGYVTNEELVQLYNIADCYVSTSINEGFGMPQLEAMLCGCPVVTSHNSAMIEVVSGRGITVKGWDKSIWVESIIQGTLQAHKQYKLNEYDWDIIVTNLLNNLKNEIN